MQTVEGYDKNYTVQIPEADRPLKDFDEPEIPFDQMTQDQKDYYEIAKNVSINAKRLVLPIVKYADILYSTLQTFLKRRGYSEDDAAYKAAAKAVELIAKCGPELSLDEYENYQLTENDYDNLYNFTEFSKAFEEAFKNSPFFKLSSFKEMYFVKPSVFGMQLSSNPPIHEYLKHAVPMTFQNATFNGGYKDYCEKKDAERRKTQEKIERNKARAQRKAEIRAEKEEREEMLRKEMEERRAQLEAEKNVKPPFEERVKNVRIVYTLCNEFIEKWDTDRLNLRDMEQAKTVYANLQTMVNRMFSEEKGIGAKLLTRDKFGNVALDEDGWVKLNEANVNEENITKAEEVFENARDWIENIDPDLR